MTETLNKPGAGENCLSDAIYEYPTANTELILKMKVFILS